jgi:undecaprenyl diphosphate synthase
MSLPDPSTVLEQLRRRNPTADPQRFLPDIHPVKIPRHVAIIMDGNGRWATNRGMPRALGHREGAKTVERILELAGNIGVEVLTLYSFSLENWRRPQEEIDALMALYVESIRLHADRLERDGIRFRQIGRKAGLPELVLAKGAELEERTRNNSRATLCLAVNYGGRAEIVDACRTLAQRVAAGQLKAEDITEDALAAGLYAPVLPDPDLLIRTAGESRISNFLLWQISYAEIHVTETLWPDFGETDFLAALRDFAGRTRKFGALSK